jgi:hypothetical protein
MKQRVDPELAPYVQNLISVCEQLIERGSGGEVNYEAWDNIVKKAEKVIVEAKKFLTKV